MISIRQQNYGLNVALYNEFTLEDFKTLEAAIIECLGRVHRPDILLDLSLLRDYTIDMAAEQLRFLNNHDNDFGRIAVVTDDLWIRLSSHISSLLTRQHPKYFDDAAEAQQWILSSGSHEQP
ncbi:STAS/SEC14 domain-containing protein [Eikenella sp. S3360]|uniref:STAS/SEC14 domain-containing protein n=1 Tax=Eikenella glucosivorans TaxID=2766967 RepID=A0ABS0N8C1_9NEIS|nr:STAS/SEC14 domain-containing protein [Eikenella glucosivorans]MBH5328543.1 STAS/SEC14 domain-containing protein [Eikenella glucosivorans]